MKFLQKIVRQPFIKLQIGLSVDFCSLAADFQ